MTLETIKNKKLGYAPKGFYQLQISISQTSRIDNYKYILPFLDDEGNPEYIMAEYADREHKPEHLSKYRKPKDIPSKYYNEKYGYVNLELEMTRSSERAEIEQAINTLRSSLSSQMAKEEASIILNGR